MASLDESSEQSLIRVLALALIQRAQDGGWLAVHYYEADTGHSYYRPPGGGVEVGERTRQAVVREMQEEFGALVRPQERLHVLENIFTLRGRQGHEVVFAWRCTFEDESLYSQDVLIGQEAGTPFEAHWVQPATLAARGIPLYPEGLPELLVSTGRPAP